MTQLRVKSGFLLSVFDGAKSLKLLCIMCVKKSWESCVSKPHSHSASVNVNRRRRDSDNVILRLRRSIFTGFVCKGLNKSFPTLEACKNKGNVVAQVLSRRAYSSGGKE